MISIERAYFSYDLSKLFIHFFSENPAEYSISELSKLDLVRYYAKTETIFNVNISPFSTNQESYIFAVDIENDIVDFISSGIIRIVAEFGENEVDSYVFASDEFYDLKAKMMSVNCDNSNISKMSKKLMTFAFLERMMISALENKFHDDARLFYDEMTRLANFGHSNIDQKNPNCAY